MSGWAGSGRWILLGAMLGSLAACGTCNPCADPCEPCSPCETVKPCDPCAPAAQAPSGFEEVVVSRRVISRSDGTPVDAVAETMVAVETIPMAASRPTSATYGRPGFEVYEEDGRLWVFATASEAHAEFIEKGEPAKRITLVGQGPDGKSLLGDDEGVMRRYAAEARYGRPGYAVFLEEGRLWVFAEGSQGHQDFLTSGEPAKSVTRVGAGPDGKTIKSDDDAVLDAYLAAW